MSKYNNVKPDHFKTAGREPQGRDVAHQVERQQYAEARIREKRNDLRDGHLDLAGPRALAGDTAGYHLSGKAGKRSSAQKLESTRPKAGASGRNPNE
jgi:hypothetical protein